MEMITMALGLLVEVMSFGMRYVRFCFGFLKLL